MLIGGVGQDYRRLALAAGPGGWPWRLAPAAARLAVLKVRIPPWVRRVRAAG